ncbi:MAG: restriction endonuclease subunit S, partial [Verrucomicrobiales bacterium]
YAHLLRLMANRGYIHIICPSVRERAPRFRFPKLQDNLLPIPPKSEQDRIVTFLGQKTAEIDALIAKKQRQIELLDEQKAILINCAVTRGLNPNVKLKPSGIDWIGDIPEHWEIKSAKHACERIIDCKNRTPEVVPDGEFFVLRTSNVKRGALVSEEITRTDFKHYTIWTERGAPQQNDVLFTREAPAGEACLFDGSIPACLGQRMMYFRTDQSQLLPQFLVHTIYQGPSATYILLKTNGSTVGHLRLPQVYALPLLLPPVAEQREILAKISATEEAEKKLIQAVESQIESLKTLRSTLIAHAVTGRIKV